MPLISSMLASSSWGSCQWFYYLLYSWFSMIVSKIVTGSSIVQNKMEIKFHQKFVKRKKKEKK